MIFQQFNECYIVLHIKYVYREIKFIQLPVVRGILEDATSIFCVILVFILILHLINNIDGMIT